MKLRVLTAVLVLALAVASSGFAQAGKGSSTAEARFKGLMQKELDAWGTMDPEKAAPFFAKEPDRIFFDVVPLKYNGWAEYAEGVKKLFAGYKSFKLILGEDARASQTGNTAWGAATIHVDAVRKDDARETFDGRWTVLWERRGKDWLVVHEHTSVPMPPEEDRSKASLYKRLGGYDALAAVTDDFIGRLVGDPKLSRFFAGHSSDSLKRIRQLVVDQLCAATGGPCVYIGRDMKTAHAGMGISEQDWQASVKHLVGTLDKFKVPAKEKGEVLAAIGGMRADIVESK